jgi:hypothetical protein
VPIRDRVVSIHQPNFLPWLGFFHKIAHSDVFVLLDDVQFPKSGAGCWTNRVKMRVGDESAWMTVPIRRNYHGVRNVNEICMDDSTPWRARIIKTLETNYRRSPHFAQTMKMLVETFAYGGDNLAEFNAIGLRRTLDYIGWHDRALIKSSALVCRGHGTDLLIAITKAVGATAYLCGGGAGGYQLDAAFAEHGVTLIYQQFTHPVYPQSRGRDFQPGLSIVDALFEIGPSATAKLLERQVL